MALNLKISAGAFVMVLFISVSGFSNAALSKATSEDRQETANMATSGNEPVGSSEAQASNDSSSKKSCCMSDILKGCKDKEQRTSKAISKLIDQASAASKSNDPEKMKAALEELNKSLSDLKSDHDKSRDLFDKLHKRIQSLKKQIKVSKEEHKKVGDIIEDESMDDIIWAY